MVLPRIRDRLLAAGVLLAAGALSCGRGGQPATGPRDPHPVLVVSDRAGAWRVYAVPGEGGAARPIGAATSGDGPWTDSMPARLADGAIVFVSDREGDQALYIVPASGNGARRLLPGGPDPLVSPSGPAPFGAGSILFAAAPAGAAPGAPRDLWLARRGAGPGPPVVIRLTGDPADDRAPAALADGRGIVFVSDRPGAPRLCFIQDVTKLDRGSAGAGAESGPAQEEVVCLVGPSPAVSYADQAPAVLDDGIVVFARAPRGGVPQLFLIDPRRLEAGARRITDETTLPYGAFEPVAAAGRRVLFTTGPAPGGAAGGGPPRWAVYGVELGGFNLEMISRTDAPYSDYTRRLAPTVAYTPLIAAPQR